MSHSSRMFHIGIQLDFEGVLLLMWGATVPLIYYGFYCDPKLQKVYWSLLSVFALACSIFTFQPRFRDPHLRPLRAATFGSFAFSSIIPVVHAAAKYGWAVQSQRMGLYWVIGTLCFNTAGATAYAVKVSHHVPIDLLDMLKQISVSREMVQQTLRYLWLQPSAITPACHCCWPHPHVRSFAGI